MIGSVAQSYSALRVNKVRRLDRSRETLGKTPLVRVMLRRVLSVFPPPVSLLDNRSYVADS